MIFLIVEFAIGILDNKSITTMLFFTAGRSVILANFGLRTKAIFEIIIRKVFGNPIYTIKLGNNPIKSKTIICIYKWKKPKAVL